MSLTVLPVGLGGPSGLSGGAARSRGKAVGCPGEGALMGEDVRGGKGEDARSRGAP
jgi:hypothetical protein